MGTDWHWCYENPQEAAKTIDDAGARIAELEANVERLQRILDSRPAINAGLPQTYIEWSQSLYVLDAIQAGAAPNH